MIKLKKSFYLFFYTLYCFCEFLDVGVSYISSVWKAFAIICFLETLILLGLLGQIDLNFYSYINFEVDPKTYAIPLGLLLSILNYFIFLHNDKWRLYISEFKKFSKLKKVLTNLIVMILIFGIFFLLIFTFHQYSKADWQHLHK